MRCRVPTCHAEVALFPLLLLLLLSLLLIVRCRVRQSHALPEVAMLLLLTLSLLLSVRCRVR